MPMILARAGWLLLCVLASAPAGAATPDSPAGNAARGAEVFLRVGCDQCHGREGQGSPITAPKLGPDGLPFVAFELFVRRPREQMPAYGKGLLADSELVDLYAYVTSRPAPASADRLPK